MANLDLGKQIGPLPLGAWIAVVAGGLGIAVWSRQNAAAEEPEIVEDVSGDEGVGEGALPGSWVDVTPKPPQTDSDSVVYDSNEAWGRAAVNWLIAQGYSPGLSNSAITKALAGGSDIDGHKMSIQEWALWSLALTKFGSPPYPVNVAPPSSVPGTVTPPAPPPKTTPPTPKPPTNRIPRYTTYTVKRGDTLSAIGRKYGVSWRTIWNFNLKYRSAATRALLRARGPNLIYAGQVFWIPR